jgi:hypothetical protein
MEMQLFFQTISITFPSALSSVIHFASERQSIHYLTALATLILKVLVLLLLLTPTRRLNQANNPRDQALHFSLDSLLIKDSLLPQKRVLDAQNARAAAARAIAGLLPRVKTRQRLLGGSARRALDKDDGVAQRVVLGRALTARGGALVSLVAQS